MKRLLWPALLFIQIFTSGKSFAQGGEWVWVNGRNGSDSTVVYGTKGIAADTNHPPGLYEAVDWMDLNGNLWIYSGLDGEDQGYGDLWKYDPVANLWTWVNGNGTINPLPVYGIEGVPSPLNTPGSRTYGVHSWTDKNGDLWLFSGFDCEDDVWRYNIASNEWTWMKGRDSTMSLRDVYGELRHAADSTHPAARFESNADWVDTSGGLWLFGGLNFARIDSGYNDMWRYNINNNQWTWMAGYPGPGYGGWYGTEGVESSSNMPPARGSYSRWQDNNGNFYLFSGWNYIEGGTNIDVYSDVWRFNSNTNNWTWIAGESTDGAVGNYGSYCIDNGKTGPASRYECRIPAGNSAGSSFYAFGGFDLEQGRYSDLWLFNVATLQWRLLKGTSGTDLPGSYGTMGVADTGNIPPGRAGSCAWVDGCGNFWIFGGQPFNRRPGNYNDVWKFIPDASCVPIAAGDSVTQITGNKSIICPNDSAQLCAPAGYSNYLWNNGDTTQCIYAHSAGNYYVTVTNASGCGVASNQFALNVYQVPPVMITVVGDTLFSRNAVSYQWFNNGQAITGATHETYVATSAGSYTVQITDSNGCIAVSNPYIISSINEFNEERISVYPNPSSSGLWQVDVSNTMLGSSLEIYDVEGRLVYHSTVTKTHFEINASLAKGVYLLAIQSAQYDIVRKLVVD